MSNTKIAEFVIFTISVVLTAAKSIYDFLMSIGKPMTGTSSGC